MPFVQLQYKMQSLHWSGCVENKICCIRSSKWEADCRIGQQNTAGIERSPRNVSGFVVHYRTLWWTISRASSLWGNIQTGTIVMHGSHLRMLLLLMSQLLLELLLLQKRLRPSLTLLVVFNIFDENYQPSSVVFVMGAFLVHVLHDFSVDVSFIIQFALWYIGVVI